MTVLKSDPKCTLAIKAKFEEFLLRCITTQLKLYVDTSKISCSFCSHDNPEADEFRGEKALWDSVENSKTEASPNEGGKPATQGKFLLTGIKNS